MKALKSYNIPFKGAKLGVNEYHFKVEQVFFENFEASPIESGNFDIAILMDKKVNLLDLEFQIKGSFLTPCDRCLAEIDIPIESEKRILIKFDDSGREDTDEVIYIGSEETIYNVGELLYEFIILSMPISKVIDCDETSNKFCDQKVLAVYDKLEQESLDNVEEEKEASNIWDELKDIKLN